MANICASCNRENPAEVNFCIYCGKPFVAAEDRNFSDAETTLLDEDMGNVYTGETEILEDAAQGEWSGETEILDEISPQKEACLIREDTGEEIIINKPNFVIGRNSKADYFLKGSKYISRNHSAIAGFDNGEWTIKDIDSTNKTYIDDEVLCPDETRSLHHGCKIRLADIDFAFYIKEGSDGNVTSILD